MSFSLCNWREAMLCCRNSAALSPDVLQAIHKHLQNTKIVFPAAAAMCIVNPSGEMIAHLATGDVNMQEVTNLVGSLKRSTLKLGDLMQADLPAMHIRGSQNLFSCYDVADKILAIYSVMNAASLELFDAEEADTKMADILSSMTPVVHKL
eukprot:TRINITY_DN4603_c0_g1_i3.p1 TRINITY_DN4603_c0_g1~~TRINITY_DN4603_c0_g1_i3.p1  ORF type:complete len:151 (+),score=28.46 TRINITY_DN4603_c0_g1_i3:167-619(+)